MGMPSIPPNLERQNFQVLNNHQQLTWLLGATDVSVFRARWGLRLFEFNFSTKYKKATRIRLLKPYLEWKGKVRLL